MHSIVDKHFRKLLIKVNNIFVLNHVLFRDIYGYNGFNLLVDLGSSLGLWLGLSAVSFLDMGIYIFRLFSRKNPPFGI